MVVLCAQQKVDHKYCYCRGGNDHEAEAEEQEAEHVVDLREPNRVHDEVQLDKDGAKRKDASQGHGRKRAQVAARWRDLARDLICTDGRFNDDLFEGDPTTRHTQWHRDDEPDDHDYEHGGEGNGTRTAAAPDEQIEEEECCEDDTRKRKRCDDEAEFPRLAVEEFICSCGDIAADKAK